MQVPKERTLPATKRVRSNWYRNRNIDPDHSGFNLELEAASNSTVSSKYRRAIAIRVAVDECQTLFIGVDPHES